MKEEFMKKKFALSATMAVFFLCASACGGGYAAGVPIR